MKHTAKLLLWIAMIIAASSSCSLDDSILSLHTIQGTITNTSNEYIAGATVKLEILNNTLEVKTDASGHFRFENVPIGLGIINLKYNEYYAVEQRIKITTASETNPIDITLRRFMDDYYLYCVPESLNLRNIDTLAVFQVNTNSKFTIASNANWLKPSNTEFSFATTVTLVCEPNNTLKSREAIITVLGDFERRVQFSVTQQAGPILTSTGIDNPGYLPQANREGVFAHFNRPVEAVGLSRDGGPFEAITHSEVVNNGLTIKLNGFSQPLLDVSSYVLRVKATDGITIDTPPFQLQTYQYNYNHLPENGATPSYLFMPDNQTCWYWGSQYSLYQLGNGMKRMENVADKHLYSAFTFSPYKNTLLGIRRKPNLKNYLNAYNALTGSFISEKELDFTLSNPITSMAAASNGKVLLGNEQGLYLLDITQSPLRPKELSKENFVDDWDRLGNLFPFAAGGETFVLSYYGSKEKIFLLNATTGQVSTIDSTDDPHHPTDNPYHIICVGMQSHSLILGYRNKIRIINTLDRSETIIPLDRVYGDICPVEKEGRITHLLASHPYDKASVINVATKQIKTIDTGDKSITFSSFSYTSKYQLVELSGSFYLFETEFFTSLIDKP